MSSMGSLRTPEMDQKYRDFVAGGGLDHECRLCAPTPLKTFTYWKIIKNNFPYDRIARVHDMLVPIRHTREQELSDAELDELSQIKVVEQSSCGDRRTESTD